MKVFDYVWIFVGNIFDITSKIKKQAINKFLNFRYKKRIKKIGKGVRFNGICRIYGLDKIEIEDNVHIGDNAFFKAEGGLFIGENVHTSRNLTIYTHNHNYKGKRLPYDDSHIFKKVTIEKNVWIGINVTILPGTHIEEGAIIGAGSVIFGNIKKLEIVGVPIYNKITKRDQEHYKQLNENYAFGGADGKSL